VIFVFADVLSIKTFDGFYVYMSLVLLYDLGSRYISVLL